jgi:hypothetical protein
MPQIANRSGAVGRRTENEYLTIDCEYEQAATDALSGFPSRWSAALPGSRDNAIPIWHGHRRSEFMGQRARTSIR